MIKSSFKLNGRAVPANRVADELMKDLKQKAAAEAVRRIKGIRCPVHGQTARLRSLAFNSGQFSIEGCCDDHIAEVRRQLRSGR